MARPRAFDEDTALQQALQLFWGRGYAGTSMEDLVAGTGLNRASLYATFGDKHQLYLRALGQYQAARQQEIVALTADATQPALYQLRQLLELPVRHTQASADRRGCFLVNAATERLPHDPDTQQLISAHQQFLEETLTAVLTRGQLRGEVRSNAAPQAQARFLVGVLNGAYVLAKASTDSQLLRDVGNTALLALA